MVLQKRDETQNCVGTGTDLTVGDELSVSGTQPVRRGRDPSTVIWGQDEMQSTRKK